MANKSISQLTAGAAVAGTDLFPDVQTVGVGPVKVTANQVGAFVLKGTYTSNTLVYDSTNSRIGIGTASPGALLEMAKDASAAVGPELRLNNAAYTLSDAAKISFYGGTQERSAIKFQVGAAAKGETLFYGGYNPTVEYMRLDGSGNLGLGVTPNSWPASVKALQIGAQAAIEYGGGTNLEISVNKYYNSGNKYIGTGYSTNYTQDSGVHAWFTAPSGTAGNAITFTQAMTLNASGLLSIPAGAASTPAYSTSTSAVTLGGYSSVSNEAIGVFGAIRGMLLLGGNYTSSSVDIASIKFLYGAKSTTDENAATIARIAVFNTANDSTSGGNLVFSTTATGGSSAERLRITSAGDVGIGTTNPFTKVEINSGGDTAPSLSVYSTPAAYAVDQVLGIIQIGSNAAGNNVPGARFSGINETLSNSGNVSLAISTRRSAVMTEALRITSAGNVGIGTTSPSTRLQVAGNVTAPQIYNVPTALTSGATIAWDANLSAVATLTLNQVGATLTPSNLVAGGTYLLFITQGAGGNKTITTWTNFKWIGGAAPTLSSSAGAVDIITGYSDGTYFYATPQLGFA